MTNTIYIAKSLDGYIAKKDNNLDWLNEFPNPERNDYGFDEFTKRIDAVIIGKNTFEVVLSFGQWMYNKAVFIISSQLKSVPKNLINKAEILNEKPQSVVNLLNSRGYKNLWIDGGKVIQAFLKARLIHEIIITTVPIILGEGIPLFTKGICEQKYDHHNTEIFSSGLVKSCYKITNT